MARFRIVVAYNTAQYLLRMRRELLVSMLHDHNEVIALVPFDSAVPELQAMGVRCVPLKMVGHSINPVTELLTIVQMVVKLRSLAPDILFCFTVKPIIYGAIAARFAGVPARFAMITGLGLLFSGNSLSGRTVRFLATHAYRHALRRCHAVFFQNREHRAWFLANRVVTEKQAIHINGSGVDLEQFPARPMGSDQLRFVMICRLLRYKGVGEYVEAATRIRRDMPDVAFELVGPLVQGPGSIGSGELAAMLKDTGVTYRGEVGDVRPLLTAATVVVLPSFYPEGVPRILIEALALGRAIITTDTPGCRTTVMDGVNGLLVEPRSVSSLENAMRSLANGTQSGLASGMESDIASDMTGVDSDQGSVQAADPGSGAERAGFARLQAMGDASRKLAESRFDVRHVNGRILEELKNAH